MKRTSEPRLACWGLMLLVFATVAVAANQPPSAGLGAPPSDAVFGIGDNIELRASGFDPEGALTKIEFYIDGSLIGEDFVPPYSMWLSNVAAGVYSYYVVAVDDAFARGTSVVSRITVTNLSPRSLNWSPATPIYTSFEWNSTSLNWVAGFTRTVFHTGDSVTIGFGVPNFFIGIDGVPMPVSPASTVLRGAGGISGGDILTGGLTVDSGRIIFSNYTSSLSFPGGTLIHGPDLTFDVSAASPGATLHFGVGPITNIAATFTFQTGDAGATLENDFVIPSVTPINNRIVINPISRPQAVVRFSGALQLGGDLSLQTLGEASATPLPLHVWSGSIVLDQSGLRFPSLSVSANGYAKGFTISGNISDGPGDATNGLQLYANYAPVRLTGANTYAHGTRIGGQSYPYGIEVAPESSLGTGDLEAYGSLTLLGSHNLASNANVSLFSGRAYLGRGVKIRLNSLKLGNALYTNGLFAGTNLIYNNYLASNGSFRLPPVNFNPTVAITTRSAAQRSSLAIASSLAQRLQTSTATSPKSSFG